MNPLLLNIIVRQLRRITGLKKPIYLVGGLVTEGSSSRDLDFVVGDKEDIKTIKKTLGKYAEFAHFIYQEQPPTAAVYMKFTGKEVKPSGKKKGSIPANEYAGN